MEKLQKENELLRAKTIAIESEKTKEELYRKAIEAMRSYAPPIDEKEKQNADPVNRSK